MATVYISIGTMKTGTTAIQTFLRENDEIMQKQGYCYPFMNLGIHKKYNDRNAHFLVYRAEDLEGEQKKAAEKAVREHAYEILGKLAEKYENIVLSDELIWHRSQKNEHFWEKLGPNFAKIGCDIKVIVYLRRQDLLIQSLYNQSVKSMPRTSKSFHECINGDFFDYYPLDYAKQLERIASGIGKENLIIRVYEKGQFEGEEQSIFSDFAKSIGLDISKGFTREKVEHNIGLNGNYLEIKRILNEIPEYAQMDDFMRTPIYRANGCKITDYQNAKTSLFTYEEQKEYLSRFEESNRRVAKEFLEREDGVLFADSIEELPLWQIEQERMYRDVLMAMGEVLCVQEMKIRKLEEQCAELKGLEKNYMAMYNSLIFRGYRKVRDSVKGKKEK